MPNDPKAPDPGVGDASPKPSPLKAKPKAHPKAKAKKKVKKTSSKAHPKVKVKKKPIAPDSSIPPDNVVSLKKETSSKKKPKPSKLSSLKSVPEIVEQNVLKIEDIENLNIGKLKDSMIRGVGYIQAALWTQAGFEYNRIGGMRSLVSKLEAEIINEDTLADLSTKDKIKLYGLVTHNMSASLNFLSNLHGNVTSGLDALSQVEKHKSSQIAPEESSKGTKDLVLEQVRAIVASKIKEKVQK